MAIPFFETGRVVMRVALHLIDSNPNQPRKHFNSNEIASLAESIQQNGLLNPISVRKCSNGRYELIAGERRLKAFRLMEEKTIPALIDQVDDRTSAVLALVENLQRSSLTFPEEAQAIATLLQHQGVPQQQLAKSLGMSQSTLANKLRILRLPEPILQLLQESGLTERHARALLPLAQDPRLEAVVQRIAESQLTVLKTERLVEALQTEQPKKRNRLLIIKDLRLFTTTIQKAVSVMQEAGIEAVSQKQEDEKTITYIIVIPKTANPQRKKALNR